MFDRGVMRAGERVVTVSMVEVETVRRDVPLLRAGFAVGALLVAVVAVTTDEGSAVNVSLMGVAVGAFLLWALRPRLPSVVLLAAVVGPVLVIGKAAELQPALFLVVLLALLVSGHEDSMAVFVGVGAVLVACPVAIMLLQPGDSGWAWGVWTMGIVAPLLMGRVYRRGVLLVEELEAARSELADRAVMEERRELARDVHDVVGHGLAGLMLHLSGARHMLDRGDVSGAQDALAEAQDMGRRSMGEVRRAVGLLRAGSESAGAPPPGGADIPRLVGSFRQAGLEVCLTAAGPVDHLDGTIGLVVYRLVQESLSNAARHASASTTHLNIAVSTDGVELDVVSVGQTPSMTSSSGFGIAGMRERVTALGGDFDAGPTADGWRVWCRIPAGSTELAAP